VTANLSRADARARADLVADVSYDIHLDVVDEGPTFDSTTTVRFLAGQQSATTFLDLEALEVSNVTVNGVAAPRDGWTKEPGRLRLEGLAEHNEVVVEARCSYTNIVRRPPGVRLLRPT